MVEVDDVVGLAEFLPDIHTLFSTYNKLYFEGYLDGCALEWSERMTLCAGICYMKMGSCTIRLSRPLLTQRPFSDTVNTLLHEMIHAYIFMKFGGTLHRDGHGPDFTSVMDRINAKSGSSITIYHTFHEEVKHCRKHMWRCTGPCKDRAPFYGWCRRSMNRPPQPADWWWNNHRMSCGGTYVKVSEPEVESKKKSGKGSPTKSGAVTKSGAAITDYFKSLGKGTKLGGGGPSILFHCDGPILSDSGSDEPIENKNIDPPAKRLKGPDPVTIAGKEKVTEVIDLT